jgi:hypothetical protein
MWLAGMNYSPRLWEGEPGADPCREHMSPCSDPISSVHSYMCVTYGRTPTLAFKFGTDMDGKNILYDNRIHTQD